MTIYLSMSFTLIAITASLLSLNLYNENVAKSGLPDKKQRLLIINLFDKKVIISVLMPAVADYLMKVVPFLFA